MRDKKVEYIPTQIGCQKKTQKIKYIMDLLKRGDEEVQLSQDKNIILLLGNTGSGKSTLAHYITDNFKDLISHEVEEGTGEFIIVDKNNKISHDSTIVSHTIFPDLVVDMKTETAYYDCPGFSDTRSGANDISGTFFTKKIIESAKSAKLIFVVNYHSVVKGVDRNDFLLLLKHTVTFIKRIDKFKNSIALVVTKVANNYVRKSGTEALVSDEKVVTSIAKYLEQVRKDILEHPELIVESDQSQDAVERAVIFLDALLFKEYDKYLRIGIFRKPNDVGELIGIRLLQSGIKALQNMINGNVCFTETSEDDFGYTVSSDSKILIHDLVKEINNHINDELVSIKEEIEKYYNVKEKDMFDLDQLENDFKILYEAFSEMQKFIINDSTEANQVIMKIRKIISDVKIIISSNYFSRILILEDYIQFLYLVSNEQSQKNKSAKLANGVKQILDYLYESQKWYSFLNNFYSRLTQYEIQNRRSDFITSLPNLTFITERTQFSDLNLHLHPSLTKIIEDVGSKRSVDLSSISLNESKLDLLKKVLEITLNNKPESSFPTADTLIIKGHIIKLSDVEIDKYRDKIKFIEVFALNKIFIDTSLDLSGMKVQFYIIAPVWEIVECQSIKLDGMIGASHSPPKAPNQEISSTRGHDGKPGRPGGPAGSFFGIGKKFISDEYLSISAHGGTGGNGQDGGDGSDGLDASDIDDAHESFKDKLTLIFFNKMVYDIFGEPGGDGGNGGVGGFKGPAGNITILEVGINTPQNKITIRANPGKPGKAGLGGKGGKGGQNCEKTCSNFLFAFFQSESMNNIDSQASNGKDGHSGSNRNGISYPAGTIMLQHSHSVINNFKSYSLDTLSNNIKRNSLRAFINELDDSEQVASLYGIKGLIEEMKVLEHRCFQLIKNKHLLIPSYQSLLQRIIKFAEKAESVEHKRVCNYLHMATLSKISTIGNSKNAALVLDIKGFLDLMTNKIKKLQKIFHETEVSGLLSQQIKSITDEINEVQKFFDTQVTLEIDIALHKIDNTIHSLINEFIALKSANISFVMKKQERIENSIELSLLLNIIKIGSSFLKFLSPVGSALEVLIAIKPIILDSLSGHEMKQEVVELPDGIKHALSEMSAFIKSRLQMILEQLKDADKVLKELPCVKSINFLQNIRETILNNKKKLEDEISKDDGYDIAIIGNAKKEIMQLLKIEEENIKTIKDMDTAQCIRAINDIQNILGVITGLYNSIKNEKNKTDLVGTIVQRADKKIRCIQTYEERIISHFITLQQELSTIGKQKVNRWKMQSTIRDVKDLMYKLTKEFNVKKSLIHCIDRLQEGMTAMIHVFDLIDSYHAEIRLYRYLSHTNSIKLTEIRISDEELKKAVDELNFITQSNLILGQYERAVSALKQRVFPFASMCLQNFSLPLVVKVEHDINPTGLLENGQYDEPKEAIDNPNFIKKSRRAVNALIKRTFSIASKSLSKLSMSMLLKVENGILPTMLEGEDDSLSTMLKAENDSLPMTLKAENDNLPITFTVENGINDLVQNVIMKIEELKNKISDSAVSLGEYDKYIHTSINTVFFVWPFDSSREAISDLLEGKEVFLKADVRKSPSNRNAVKFNVIDINLKARNKALQEQLNKDLENFEVTMVHSGNSYYRCGDKFYIISCEKQVIKFRFERNSDKEPTTRNEIYKKIKENVCMLSPYTMWSIQLTCVGHNTDIFHKYQNHEIDLELLGNGQYVDEGFNKYICKENLEDHYKVDTTLNNCLDLPVSGKVYETEHQSLFED